MRYTLPTAEVLSGKNARAWVSMVLYLIKCMKIKILKRKKNPGSQGENWLDWLCYLAGNF